MQSANSPMQQGPLTPTQRQFLGSPGPSVPQSPRQYDLMLREFDQLQGKHRATLQQLEQAQIELDDARKTINRNNDIIHRLQVQIAALEETIQKQKITISNQSKTISDPKSLRSKRSGAGLPTTPLRPTGLETPFANNRGQPSVFDQPPPRFELPTNINGPMNVPSSGGSLAPVAHQQLGLSPVPDSAPSSMSTRSFPHIDFNRTLAEFVSRSQELWRKAEVFGQMHANFPDVRKDSKVEQRLKDYLMAISDKYNASTLLGKEETRFYVVAKAINFYLVRDVLKITVVKGFDPVVDAEIGQIKNQLFPDTPSTVRDMMFVAMANQVNNVKRIPGFSLFFQQRIQQHAEKLWKLVGPLTYDGRPNAWSDLFTIVSEAHGLSLDMYSVPFEYKFDFPVNNDAFQQNIMVNRDPIIKGDPTAMTQNGVRVRLGVTPIIKMRDNSRSSSHIQLIHLSNVLLKPAPRSQT